MAADIDQDGGVDWVSSNLNSQPTIEVRWRDAAGDYARSTMLALDWAGAPAAGGVAVGDLNGDGRPDIVATVYGPAEETSVIAVFYQGVAGQFRPPVYIKTSRQPGQVVMADINADGRADLLVSHDGYPEQFGMYLQRPDGTLETEELYDADQLRGGPIVVGDVNGDGRLDVLVGAALFLQQGGVAGSVATAPAPGSTLRRGVMPSVRRR